MKQKDLTPKKLRAILAILFGGLLIIGIVIFAIGYKQITLYSHETQEKAKEAQESNSKVTQLISTENQLQENSSVVYRASQLVAESKYYAYQDQIIQDINIYATRAGVTLHTITFNEAAASTSTSTSSTQATTATPSGIKSTTATVEFKGDVNYYSLLRFIHYLEQGLFRMSILGISFTKSTDQTVLAKDPDAVTCQPINIEVYIKGAQ